jgi:membrane protease YdiL (CAAX protease family)
MLNRSVRVWNTFVAFCFILSACLVCWAFSFAASFGPDFKIALHHSDFAVDTKFILLTSATLIPALYCFFVYPEARSSLRKVNANWIICLAAIATGLSLPFLSYLGSHNSELPWGRDVAVNLGRVFVWNIFLAPLWEEIVWRGCFLKKVRSFSSKSGAILLMSVGWTIWHGGYIAYLYSGGIPIDVLRILPLTYFCVGIILGSVFELGKGSIWPCVLLHTSLNAATTVYYTTFNRASELGSYVSELIFTAVAAAAFFTITVRRDRSAEQSPTLSAE